MSAANEHHSFVPIRLTAGGGCGVEVSLFVRGEWVPVIRDTGSFVSHIVEPAGIEKRIEDFFSPKSPPPISSRRRPRGASKKL